MTHAHDRTYIASLGFADKDKAHPDHEAGCIWMAKGMWLRQRTFDNLEPEPDFERPLLKGTGSYQTVVGFVDLVLQHYKMCSDEGCPQGNHRILFSESFIEVKVNRVPVSDILRQLRFYDEFTSRLSSVGRTWVVAVAWPLSKDERGFLKSWKHSDRSMIGSIIPIFPSARAYYEAGRPDGADPWSE